MSDPIDIDALMQTPEMQELAALLARDIVAAVRPEELAIFDATIVVDQVERRGAGGTTLGETKTNG